MAVRQEDVNSAMISILKKMDVMVESTKATYEQSLVVLNSVDTVMKNEVSTELKKQTSLLMSIEAKIGKSEESKAAGGDPKEFGKLLGSFATGLVKIIKAVNKLNDKAGDKLSTFFTKLTNSLSNLQKEFDEGKVKALGALLTGIATSVLKFGLALALYTIISPLAMVGAVMFGLTIRLLMKSAGVVNKESAEGIAAVLGLAKGVLLFGLGLVVFTIMAPIAMIGAVLFGLTIRLLLFAAGSAKKEQAQAMNAVLNLSKGILLFALAMVVVTLLAPIVLIGTLIISASLFVLSFALNAMGSRQARRGVVSLLFATLGIALLGLTILTFATLVKPMDALFTVLTVATIGLLFVVAGNYFKEILKGSLAMAATSLAITMIGMSLSIFKKANMTWEDAGILGAVVVGLGLAMWTAGKFATQIFEGSLALGAAAVALLIISTGLLVFKKANLTLADAGILGAVIVGMGIVFGLAGAGPIPGFIIAGGVALGIASLALIPLSIGLILFKKANMQLIDAATLSATIGAIAISFAAMGLASPLIFVGSAALAVAAVALLPITASLAIFKSTGWKKGTDDENLKSALGAVISGFLGGDMPGGILDSIKFAGQAAARAALLFVTAPAMILAGAALIPITASLAIFKKSGFTSKDADNLEYMIGSIVRAFGIVTDKERQKKMGFSVDPLDLFLGVASLAGAGRVLAGLAEGVQAWANLEVSEWEVINGGTKDAKLVIKGKRKLSQGDFDNAAYGMAKVITAIAAPFAMVGKLNRGQSSGNPIYDKIFEGGLVSEGIEALRYSGDTIVNLAKGVQAFATMEYTEYEVVNAGTPEAKLVPKSKTKLGDTEITAASNNIAKVISVVAKAFADVGEMEANSDGIFANGYVNKGVKALAGVGKNLSNIVDSVLKMANREIPTFELIGGGTKDAKLVPGKPHKISDTELTNAATTIMDILKIVASGFYDIGKAEDDSSSWWGDGYIRKGVSAISGIGDTVAKITDSVIKIATGQMPTFKEVDGKIVSGAPIQVSDSMLKSAAKTINAVMMTLGRGVYDFGVFYEKNQAQIDLGNQAIPSMSEALAKLANANEKWSNIKDPATGLTNFQTFTQAIFDTFDSEKNANISQKLDYMNVFVNNIKTMAEPAQQLKAVADNMDRVQKSMKLTKDHINAMDLKKLTLTDALMRSLASIAKNPEAMARAVEGGIDKAFKDLAEALKELSNQNAQQQQQFMDKMMNSVSGSGTTTPAGVPAAAPATGGGAQSKTQPPANANEIKTAFAQALAAYFNANVINVKQSTF
jgi:hypothetical protein